MQTCTAMSKLVSNGVVAVYRPINCWALGVAREGLGHKGE